MNFKDNPNSLPPAKRFKLAEALAEELGITIGEAFTLLGKEGIESAERKLRDPEHNFSDRYDYSTGNVYQVYHR
ncbi:hypothetical protein BWI93_11580 [Siphonobacter sp. BAB-5385]|uniref:hypothetical protein n=1 Tax=Siphonobacter sp. BAB-5385 TaxID=1864822 RepID=UPI000B9DF003|nr:hypothetical protein [Siphonobacter sp. BAB-5385]OZI07989.1 hypothetical protein BWI93_11580 [Siphonobacter sp. BAB-5385]